MSFRLQRLALSAAALAVATAFAPAAFATNGYFSHGYGMKAKGMAGAAIALPQDAIAAAYNPAGFFFVADRLDLGVDWFSPTRGASVRGHQACANPPTCSVFFSADGSYDGSDKKSFFIPEFGYKRALGANLAFGLSVYGNGGMNTDYTTAFPLFGSSPAGVNLEQAFVAPSVAWQVAPGQVLGASLNFAYQRFKATGLENFTGDGSNPFQPRFSQFPTEVTNKGSDTSTGWGLRVGWMGKLAPCSVGLTYQTKTKMSEFDDYRGLFAEAGGFDIPANYGAGVACPVVQNVTVAFDVVRIEYSGVKSIANPLLPNLFQAPLGSAGGAGFGWEDVTAYKLGLQWQVNPDLALRGGFNYGKQPIPARETLFNVLAPGVVEEHYTLGATLKVGGNGELTGAFMYAPEKTVRGANSIPAPFGGGEADIRLKEVSFGIAYGWKF